MLSWISSKTKTFEMLKNGVSLLFRGFSSYFCTNLRGLRLDEWCEIPLIEGCEQRVRDAICSNIFLVYGKEKKKQWRF